MADVRAVPCPACGEPVAGPELRHVPAPPGWHIGQAFAAGLGYNAEAVQKAAEGLRLYTARLGTRLPKPRPWWRRLWSQVLGR